MNTIPLDRNVQRTEELESRAVAFQTTMEARRTKAAVSVSPYANMPGTDCSSARDLPALALGETVFRRSAVPIEGQVEPQTRSRALLRRLETPAGACSSVRVRPSAGLGRCLKSGSIAIAACAVAIAGLFAANGLSGSWRVPETGSGGAVELVQPIRELRVMAYNIAKCSFHEGGVSFAAVATIRSRLDRIAEAIEHEQCDLVCLSEVVIEAGPCPINQVEYLARKCGFAHFASGDNYSFGFPFYRIRSGNAILSRLPLTPRENLQLAGGRGFWEPTNNRRMLVCEVELNGASLLTASVRNDSFDIDNNLAQTQQILAYIGDRPALLAGDFNAEPETRPMQLLLATGRFSGFSSEPPTFPARAPKRRIDYILAPAAWTLVESRVLDTGVSDHLAVLSVFRIP